MLQTPQQHEILYFEVQIFLDLDGMPGWELVKIPLKTVTYKNLWPGVTVTKWVEKMVSKRLKGVKNMRINLQEVSKHCLERDLGMGADLFPALVCLKKA